MQQIMAIYLSEETNDSYLDICNKWTYEDYVYYQHAIADKSLIKQVLQKDAEKGISNG